AQRGEQKRRQAVEAPADHHEIGAPDGDDGQGQEQMGGGQDKSGAEGSGMQCTGAGEAMPGPGASWVLSQLGCDMMWRCLILGWRRPFPCPERPILPPTACPATSWRAS